jgi:hypothetical protein
MKGRPVFLPKPVRKSGGARPPHPADQNAKKLPRHPHTDDFFVTEFAETMKDKLALKRGEGRGGWENKEECSGEFLSQLLREHVEKGDPVDVANFCMMLHQRGERISPAPQPHLAGVTDAERLEDLRLAAKAIRTYMPETLPAGEDGKIHFARALAEAAADAIEAVLATMEGSAE